MGGRKTYDDVFIIIYRVLTYKNIDILNTFDYKYGSESPADSGNWNGMIGEVLAPVEDGGADFAIADLSMTSQRAAVVDFSMPWLTIGILYNKW